MDRTTERCSCGQVATVRFAGVLACSYHARYGFRELPAAMFKLATAMIESGYSKLTARIVADGRMEVAS